MKIISSRTHGIIDYLVGVLLILAPTLFDFRTGDAAEYVPVVLGISTIVYSLLTQYELGALRVLPFRAHLAIDAFSGVFLALSPWLFGFADRVFMPHLIVGLLEIGTVLMTRAQPGVGTHTPTTAVR